MSAKIQYIVTCPDPHTHYFHVEIMVSMVGTEPVELAMPVWTPGAYQVHDFAGRVHGVEFSDDTGRPLRWTKTNKTTWQIRPAHCRILVGRYKVFAFETEVDKSYVDDQRATLNGAGVYLYVVGRTMEPHQVTFRPPPSWKLISTGLTPLDRPARAYVASSYDELIDCPVMMGNHKVETFKVRGVPHHVALVGKGNYEVEQLLDDTRKIVEQGIAVFNDLPYSNYTFFMEMTNEGGGGLEHANSTHMIFPRWGFKPRKEYVVALGLISHEYFHTWNVKRLRPTRLGPFDYSREVYTPLLWFAEGFTSYYDQILLRRGGSITVREYLDELGREIRRLNLSPGRLQQSLEESSFDAWIKLYRPTPDSPNTTISYYNKGCLFGMALDLSIRQQTRNRKTLDDVMRLLYNETFKKKNQGFTSDDIESACEEIVGRSLKPLFDRIVRGVDEIDWERYLNLAGLEISSKQEAVPEKKRKPGDEGVRSYLGIRLKPHAGAVVSQIIAGGGAHASGLAPGDELIALDGFRLDEGKLEKWLGQLPSGHSVRFTISRAGVLREVDVVLSERPLVDFSIQPRKTATASQKALFKEWMKDGWNKIDRPAHGFEFRPREKVY